MKIYQKIITAFSFLLLSNSLLFAQGQDNISVVGKGVAKEGRILLRWSPENYDTWLNAKTNGYKIERRLIGVGDDIFSSPKEIVNVAEDFRVVPKEQWQMQFGKMDTLAYSALYDEEFLVYINNGNSESGEFFKAYQLEEERKNRFIYSLFAAEMSPQVAGKMGLRFDDSNIEPQHRYAYYIYPVLKDGKLGVPAIVEVWNNEEYYNQTMPSLPKPEARGEDKLAVLNINIEGASKVYSYYDLYRRQAGVGNFQKVNQNPILFSNGNEKGGGEFLAYTAPLPNNDLNYEFYFTGHDAFQRGMSSPFVTVKGVHAPLQATVRISSVIEVNSAIKINWEFPDSLNAKLKGFKVLRSEDAFGKFMPVQATLLGRETRTFTTVPPKGAAYYSVVAIDFLDREISSISVLGQVKDITPPVKPAIISCESDNTGNVLIKWKKNPDSDIKGYRVFLSSIKNEEHYFQVTQDVVADTVFNYTTTLNTLSEEAYFKIAAEDLHSNYSVNSEVCVMKRPDVIPPVAPLISKADVTSTGVDLAWIESSSSDVVSHRVERKEMISNGNWEVLATFVTKGKAKIPAYLDNTASNLTTYLYRIAAVDDADLVSYSKVMKVKPAMKRVHNKFTY